MKPWEISRLSDRFQVRHLTAEDVPAVLRLCRGNPLFYQHCPPEATEESILEDMVKLPPRTGPEDKHYIGYFEQDTLVAVMDLIRGYPEAQAAFIGFFMLAQGWQKKGVGTWIIGELCQYLEERECSFLRLDWIRGNPQSEHFWHSNGFSETGIVVRQENYSIVCAQRILTDKIRR